MHVNPNPNLGFLIHTENDSEQTVSCIPTREMRGTALLSLQTQQREARRTILAIISCSVQTIGTYSRAHTLKLQRNKKKNQGFFLFSFLRHGLSTK